MKTSSKIALGTITIVSVYFLAKWLKKLSFNPKNKKILFIGDSHTLGVSWPAYLAKEYNFTEINLAKGGTTTATMLQTMNSYLQNNKCDAVFIYGGANDAYSPTKIETTISNIQKMVDLANSKDMAAFVVLGYNPMKVSYNRVATTKYVTTQAGMNELTKKYRDLQNKMRWIKRATIIPVWNDADYSDTIGDALHLKQEAKIKFANFVGKKAFGF